MNKVLKPKKNIIEIISFIFFIILSLFNIFLVYQLTDGKPIVSCFNGFCERKNVYLIFLIIISFSMFLYMSLFLYKKFGKKNISMLIKKIFLLSIFIVLFIFIFMIVPYIEASTKKSIFYNYEYIFGPLVITFFCIYTMSAFIEIIVFMLPVNKNEGEKINYNKQILFFIIIIQNFLTLNYLYIYFIN